MRNRHSLIRRSIHVTALTLLLSGCSVSYMARSADQYREDTRALLESNESSFRSCYESLISEDPQASGTVAVEFEVAAETGKIGEAKSLPSSTAPDGLQTCVVEGLNGLTLEPPDERTGMATMTFSFERG